MIILEKAKIETWLAFGDGTVYELAENHKGNKDELEAIIKANPQAYCLVELFDKIEVTHNDMIAYIIKAEYPKLEVYTNGNYIELLILR